MPAQDSGSLDQNIQLIRALFVPVLVTHLMTFFHCRSSGIHMLCAFLPPSADVVFHNGSSRKDLLFYLATNGIWKSAAATYLHVCQALREPFVHSFRGECEVKQSAAGQL